MCTYQYICVCICIYWYIYMYVYMYIFFPPIETEIKKDFLDCESKLSSAKEKGLLLLLPVRTVLSAVTAPQASRGQLS